MKRLSIHLVERLICAHTAVQELHVFAHHPIKAWITDLCDAATISDVIFHCPLTSRQKVDSSAGWRGILARACQHLAAVATQSTAYRRCRHRVAERAVIVQADRRLSLPSPSNRSHVSRTYLEVFQERRHDLIHPPIGDPPYRRIILIRLERIRGGCCEVRVRDHAKSISFG
jgi:hypothetical protein